MNGFKFAISHMQAVRSAIGILPMSIFMGVEDAPAKKDLEEATDLILTLDRIAIAVRIRRAKYYHGNGSDFSIRYECHGNRTEIHKLRDGFGDYYFAGFSANNKDELRDYWFLDLNSMRNDDLFSEAVIAARGWPVHPNGDGTAGLYIPLRALNSHVVARRSVSPIESGQLTQATRSNRV